MQVLYDSVYALHLGLNGELAVASVEGVYDLHTPLKRSRMRGHLCGAVIYLDGVRG